jgi:hypothetical protein
MKELSALLAFAIGFALGGLFILLLPTFIL